MTKMTKMTKLTKPKMLTRLLEDNGMIHDKVEYITSLTPGNEPDAGDWILFTSKDKTSIYQDLQGNIHDTPQPFPLQRFNIQYGFSVEKIENNEKLTLGFYEGDVVSLMFRNAELRDSYAVTFEDGSFIFTNKHGTTHTWESIKDRVDITCIHHVSI